MEEAARFLVEHTTFEEPNARAEVQWYSFRPTYPMSYLLGRTMLLDLRADEQRRLGDRFSLRDFHDTLLRNGSIPISFHRRLLERGRSRVVYWPGAAAGIGAPTDRPERIAERFVAMGAPLVHLVDFEGARTGVPGNLDAVGAIASKVAVPLQVAGGVDGPDQIRLAFAAGASTAPTTCAPAWWWRATGSRWVSIHGRTGSRHSRGAGPGRHRRSRRSWVSWSDMA